MLIQGNCDERGSREYNIALGQRRAEGVKRMLVLMGATEAQVEPVSLGEEKPRCVDHNEACWWQNRRSDMLYGGNTKAMRLRITLAVGLRFSRARPTRPLRRRGGAQADLPAEKPGRGAPEGDRGASVGDRRAARAAGFVRAEPPSSISPS